MSNYNSIALLIAVAALAAACDTLSAGPRSGAGGPKGEVPLGDYGASQPARIADEFAAAIAGRYPPGFALQKAVADLTRSKFDCRSGRPRKGGKPPAEVCRRALADGRCTHTWQVHLFDAAGKGALTRVRGLYDKTCGEDLLGS